VRKKRKKREKAASCCRAFRNVRTKRTNRTKSGDKRDDSGAYRLRIGERPVCHPAAVSSSLGWLVLSGGVVLSELSKMLNKSAH
jgi:hypothetical protein